MSTMILPEPIAAYFAADQHHREAFAHCFTTQAVVKDEGHVRTGLDAIRAWKAAASAKYRYTTAPLELELQDGFHVVRAQVAGTFPGSPVDLRYRFRLERGLIASLEITA